MDPEIFKNPLEFRPDRWLEPGAHERLDPYFVSFSRGTRSCVGMNLALAELHIVFATVIRRFPNLKLYDTRPEHAIIQHDFIAAMWKYKEGDMGLQVKG
jgi:cytochrome P450